MDIQLKKTSSINIDLYNKVYKPTSDGGVDIVQTTGTSTTSVMSQDATTQYLNKKADRINIETISTISQSTFTLKNNTRYYFNTIIDENVISDIWFAYEANFEYAEIDITFGETLPTITIQTPSPMFSWIKTPEFLPNTRYLICIDAYVGMIAEIPLT